MISGYLSLRDGEEILLDREHGRVAHLFEERTVLAVNAALAAERPLLVRGEPGTGKSQLAEAAAQVLGRAFISKVLDARVESQDLFWTLDAVERLARAQVIAALGGTSELQIRELLDENHFVAPGPLWWAFDWESAKAQAARVGARVPVRTPDAGCVILLDEIDKADTSVPNGLLEALGSGSFPGPGKRGAIVRKSTNMPLVVVTTNEERALPDAFLRRCLVLQLALPTAREELIAFLVARGRAHFPSVSDALLIAAAEQLAADRAVWLERRLLAPGQAEYLDLIRAVSGIAGAEREQLAVLRRVADFTFKKHPAEERA